MKSMSKAIIALFAILASLISGVGLYTSDVTNVKSYVSEHGGTRIEEALREPIIYTGLDFIEQINDVVTGNVFNEDVKQTLQEAKDKIPYFRERKQSDGTCTKESEDILTILSLIKLGLKPAFTEPFLDIDHAYWIKEYMPKEDNGASPLQEYESYVKNGRPINLTEQRTTPKETAYSEVVNKIDEDVYRFKIDIPYKLDKKGYTADGLFQEIYDNPDTMFRISTKNMMKDNKYCVSWFFTETPYIRDLTGCSAVGGHSMTGVPVGLFLLNGNESVAIYESTGSVNIHYVKLSVLRTVLTSWETYKVVSIDDQIDTNSDFSIIKKVSLQIRQTSDEVKLLEEYLKEKRYFDYTPNNYFGTYTRDALSNYLFNETGVRYSGNYWGKISQSTV